MNKFSYSKDADFECRIDLPLAQLQLIGTKDQILKTLAILKLRHCVWETDDKYYSQKSYAGIFFYHLANVRYVPPKAICLDEPRLYFWYPEVLGFMVNVAIIKIKI